MKKKNFNILTPLLTLAIIIAPLPPFAFGANGNCPDDIAGYWKLDETAAGSYVDEIGGNDGTCSGSQCPASTTTNGVISNFQIFDGSTDSINVAADGSFNWSASQSFTIELWMRHDPVFSALEVFVGRQDDTSGLQWYLGANSSGNAQAYLKPAGGSPTATLTLTKTLGSNSSDPTWHHVALVRDASLSKATLFVDGQTVTQSYSNSTSFTSSTAPMTFGALNGGNRFDGGLDEVAIYGRALTVDELNSHYYVARDYCGLYDTPVAIMPMGDSITTGVWDAVDFPPVTEQVSYRLPLAELLNPNRFWFDFIGSETNGKGLDPTFDEDHAGFPGLQDNQLYVLLDTGYDQFHSVQVTPGAYLDSYLPEIILLHIGTNALDTSSADVETVLDRIDTQSKNITVLLARIIDWSPNKANVTTFNTNVASMAAGRIAQGDKIIMIDMQGAITNYTIDTTSPYTDGDMYNQLHPNPTGYDKMAAKWFDTLETILPQSEVPVITSTAVTDAGKGQLYTYTVTATGPPSPTFSLISKPQGMTIDTTSGLIQWTPTAVGDEDVTVQAENWTGVDTQSFTISVTDLPHAVSDAYSGIAQGGSITVSAAQGVLSNDTGSSTLTAILASDVSHGSLSFNSDGSFTYTHDGSNNASDSFTYAASDGTAQSAPVTVSLTISISDDNGGGGGGGGGGCFIGSLQ